jgi:hypothetical protein
VNAYKRRALTTPVRDGGWGIRKFNLDDLYVRFFPNCRTPHRQERQGSRQFISNFHISGRSLIRGHAQAFPDRIRFVIVVRLHVRRQPRNGKQTPDGKNQPTPSVFSTEKTAVGHFASETAICVMVRKEKRPKTPTVRFQHYWGVTETTRTCWLV